MIYWPRTQAEQNTLLEWAAKQVGARSLLYPTPAAVVDSQGSLLAVAIYHEFRKTDVQLSFAAYTPRWATRSNIHDLLAHPFENLGVRRVTAMTGKRNRPARRILEFAGFRLEGVLREATDTGALCLYGIIRQDFDNGTTKRTAANATARPDSAEPASRRRCA